MFMPKLLVWTLRLVLLLLTPLFLFCYGVARSMLWLDAWAAGCQMADLKLAQRQTFEPSISTERGNR